MFPEILLFKVKLSSTFVNRLIAEPVYLYWVFFKLTAKSFFVLSVNSLSESEYAAGVFWLIVILNVREPWYPGLLTVAVTLTGSPAFVAFTVSPSYVKLKSEAVIPAVEAL